MAAPAAGSDGDVQLLGDWYSVFSNRVRIALNLKSVKYDYLVETLGTKSQLLLKSNPVYKRIPVFIHHGKPICESLIILEYIDEVWASSSSGPAILPSDPYDRAIARFWAGYIDGKLMPAFKIILRGKGEDLKIALEQVVAGFQLLEEAFKECSKGKSFFGGDNIGYLDIVLGSFLVWIKVMEENNEVKFIDPDKTPLLMEWAERFCAVDAVKDVTPDIHKVAEFAKAMPVP